LPRDAGSGTQQPGNQAAQQPLRFDARTPVPPVVQPAVGNALPAVGLLEGESPGRRRLRYGHYHSVFSPSQNELPMAQAIQPSSETELTRLDAEH